MRTQRRMRPRMPTGELAHITAPHAIEWALRRILDEEPAVALVHKAVIHSPLSPKR
jgi:hypothetical protein